MNHIVNIDLIILFFFLGALASWARSDLEIPSQISKFLSIFLLLTLGLKGGHEVRFADNLSGFLPSLSIGAVSCIVIPILIFFGVRRRLGIANAAALAATYGSVSAITFITAKNILALEEIQASGYMVAIMALMEIPAILIGVYLYFSTNQKTSIADRSVTSSVLSSKSVVLLLGGFLIGLLLDEKHWTDISPVVKGAFKGVLAFFLIDLGSTAQKQLRQAWQNKYTAVFLAVFFPLLAGTLTLFLASALKVPVGDQILLAVLAGSASYIAAPASVRTTMPDANPGLYLSMPLALTFPMNLIFGISYYIELANFLRG